MARTIEQIQAQMLTAKGNEPALSELNSTSKTAIWRLWIYIVAVSIWTLEKLFDSHKEEIDQKLQQLKPHTARWYRHKATSFQYGFDLLEDTDMFNNTNKTDEEIEKSKIIKYSAVTESQIESRLIVKIATEKAGRLTPISSEELNAFESYISEIKDAGVRISVINYQPDRLKLRFKIYRDPLVLDASGTSILTGKKPVEDALQQFMKELPFNGELVLAHLIDKLQKAEGVKIPHLVQAQTSWIEASTSGYSALIDVPVKTIPVSGYFAIDFINEAFKTEIEYAV